MRTVPLFRHNRNQTIHIPKDMEFHGVSELEILREGDTLILRPARPSWTSLREMPASDPGFLIQRPGVIKGVPE